MSAEGDKLLPCPWCGGTDIHVEAGHQVWLGMRYGDPVSWEVNHWCPKVEGQPAPRMLRRVGRLREDAVAAWNTRVPG